jgi:hypothetical protein
VARTVDEKNTALLVLENALKWALARLMLTAPIRGMLSLTLCALEMQTVMKVESVATHVKMILLLLLLQPVLVTRTVEKKNTALLENALQWAVARLTLTAPIRIMISLT